MYKEYLALNLLRPYSSRIATLSQYYGSSCATLSYASDHPFREKKG